MGNFYHVGGIPYAPAAFDSPTSLGDLGDDTMTDDIELGFEFSFFGRLYSKVSVCSNGFLVFKAGSTPANTSGTLPNISFAPLIAFGWQDLVHAADDSRYETQGTDGNHVFILEFAAVNPQTGSGSITVQVKLFEASGAVEIHTLADDITGNTTKTQGIQGDGATYPPLTYPVRDRNDQDYTLDQDGVRFSIASGGYLTQRTDFAPEALDDGATDISADLVDPGNAAINLPFPLQAGGKAVTGLTVAANGTFLPATADGELLLAFPRAVVFADLFQIVEVLLDTSAPGSARWQVLGGSPNRILAIDLESVPALGGPTYTSESISYSASDMSGATSLPSAGLTSYDLSFPEDFDFPLPDGNQMTSGILDNSGSGGLSNAGGGVGLSFPWIGEHGSSWHFSSVKGKVFGSSPDRIVVCELVGYRQGHPSELLSVQIKFFETSSIIEFHTLTETSAPLSKEQKVGTSAYPGLATGRGQYSSSLDHDAVRYTLGAWTPPSGTLTTQIKLFEGSNRVEVHTTNDDLDTPKKQGLELADGLTWMGVVEERGDHTDTASYSLTNDAIAFIPAAVGRFGVQISDDTSAPAQDPY